MPLPGGAELGAGVAPCVPDVARWREQCGNRGFTFFPGSPACQTYAIEEPFVVFTDSFDLHNPSELVSTAIQSAVVLGTDMWNAEPALLVLNYDPATGMQSQPGIITDTEHNLVRGVDGLNVIQTARASHLVFSPERAEQDWSTWNAAAYAFVDYDSSSTIVNCDIVFFQQTTTHSSATSPTPPALASLTDADYEDIDWDSSLDGTTPTLGTWSLRAIMNHELGHCIGFDDNDLNGDVENRSLMYRYIANAWPSMGPVVQFVDRVALLWVFNAPGP